MSNGSQCDFNQTVIVERIALDVPGQYLGLATLNRPKEMNPINWDTIKKLRSALEDLSTEKGVRVIALTGAGKAFSAGGDLKSYLTLQRNPDEFSV
jgi:enoyl-CoA hydratase/carnithine racemase